MLRLYSTTRKDWLSQSLHNLDEILLDHAHCEKKAASMAVSFLFRYPEHPEIMKPLSELAREELRHFEHVLQIMQQRDIPFKRQKPSTYAGRLVKIVRRDEPERMLDIMICAALIEARSCERMKILSEGLIPIDTSLAQFYKGLLVCEARHHQMYIDILDNIYDKDIVRQRLTEIAKHESEVLSEPDDFPRLHS
jgi:tRNA 2-(methylsulfanyl)-N6-isopentenyladenosine37 hydroxylase